MQICVSVWYKGEYKEGVNCSRIQLLIFSLHWATMSVSETGLNAAMNSLDIQPGSAFQF